MKRSIARKSTCSVLLLLAIAQVSMESSFAKSVSRKLPAAPIIQGYSAAANSVTVYISPVPKKDAQAIRSFQYRIIPSANWHSVSPKNNQVVIRNLKNGKPYRIVLRARNSIGLSAESKIITVIATANRLAAPEISDVEVSSKSLEIAYALPSFTGEPNPYAIEYSLDSGSSWNRFGRLPKNNVLRISSLDNNRAYCIRLRLVNPFGPSLASQEKVVLMDSELSPLSLMAGEAISGATPFIAKVPLTGIRSELFTGVRFAISPKEGSDTTPISASYSKDYLTSHDFYSPGSSKLDVPVFGLYADYNNRVTITYTEANTFDTELVTNLNTPKWQNVGSNPDLYNNPEFVVKRNNAVALDFSYFAVKSFSTNSSPIVFDTDGNVRWVGTAGISTQSAIFMDNALYQGAGSTLTRTELFGPYQTVGDYAAEPNNVTNLGHHNYDRGKYGILVEADTKTDIESTILEISKDGTVLDTWDVAKIIEDDIRACGEDPSELVRREGHDWFHNNAAAYWPSQDTLVVSGRELFVIGIDYSTHAIKWILGDTTKYWGEFKCLTRYALKLSPGTVPPIGQHAVSITSDDSLLLFDNGKESLNQAGKAVGRSRKYGVPRKYKINFSTRTANEVWSYHHLNSDSGEDEPIQSPICSSVYEFGSSYLVDFASENYWGSGDLHVRLVGLGADNRVGFEYRFPGFVPIGWNAIPIDLSRIEYR